MVFSNLAPGLFRWPQTEGVDPATAGAGNIMTSVSSTTGGGVERSRRPFLFRSGFDRTTIGDHRAKTVLRAEIPPHRASGEMEPLWG